MNNLAEEVQRIRRSWEYACARHYLVPNRDPAVKEPTAPLRWNRPQRKLAEVMLRQQGEGKPVRVAMLKSRQFGGSTLVQSFLFHACTSNKNRAAITVGNDEENAEHVHGISRGIFSRLNPILRPMVQYNNKEELAFANPEKAFADLEPGLQSRMVCQTAGAIAKMEMASGAVAFGRGQTFHYAHLSEVAFWPHPDKLLQSLMSAIPNLPGTAVVLESTANMRGDYWHAICKDSMDGKNEFEFVFVAWFEHDSAEYRMPVPPGGLGELTDRERWLMEEHGVTPEQIQWKRWKLQSIQFRGDHDAFLREYPEDEETCFTLSGNSVFGKMLAGVDESQREPAMVCDLVERKDGISWFERPGAELQVYELPQDGQKYVIGADVAEGLEQDRDDSAAVVGNARGEVVATWVGKLTPAEFALPLGLLGRWYNTALLAVERNGPGLGTLETLEQDYENLYYESLSNGRFGAKTDRVGWRTTKTSKTQLIKGGQVYLLEHPGPQSCLRDMRLISQLGTFVKHPDGSTGSSPGCRDDLAISFLIMLQALTEVVTGTQTISYMGRKTLRASTGKWNPEADDSRILRLPRLGRRRTA